MTRPLRLALARRGTPLFLRITVADDPGNIGDSLAEETRRDFIMVTSPKDRQLSVMIELFDILRSCGAAG